MAAKHELYVIRGKTLDTIADNVRTVLGIDPDEPIRFDETTLNNTTQANGDIDAQADLIAQIKTALEGKAAGGGGTEELEQIIDQSGVLDSTEGSVDDKVGELIDYANFKNIIQESLYANTAASVEGRVHTFRNTNVTDVSMFDFSKNGWLASAFQNTKIEELEIDVSKAKYMSLICAGCLNLKRVVFKNMNSITIDFIGGFNNCPALESVGTLDVSGVSNFWSDSRNFPFGKCTALREIDFVENCIKGNMRFDDSPDLSANSIRNIFGGLNSDITGKALTLKLVAVKKAFETSEGANDGDTSAEWLALKDTKPNWTITLS